MANGVHTWMLVLTYLLSLIHYLKYKGDAKTNKELEQTFLKVTIVLTRKLRKKLF